VVNVRMLSNANTKFVTSLVTNMMMKQHQHEKRVLQVETCQDCVSLQNTQ